MQSTKEEVLGCPPKLGANPQLGRRRVGSMVHYGRRKSTPEVAGTGQRGIQQLGASVEGRQRRKSYA